MLDTNALYVISIILTQAIMLIVIFESLHFSTATGYRFELVSLIFPYFSFIVVSITLITIVSVSKLSQLSQKKQELEIKEMNNQHIRQMNEALRGQRHDFSNHLQVIYSMVKNNKISSTLKYLEELIGEVIETNEIHNISSPAVAAIVISKLHTAKSRGIQLEYDIQGDLDERKIKPVHLSRILGNLLDNAIEAVENMEEGRKVRLKVYGDDSGIYISVKNPGMVSPEIMGRLFEAGVSTKNGKNRGMGLNIVKSIVDDYNGRIEFASEPGKGVSVFVKLPR